MATGTSSIEVCREKLLMASLKAPSQQHINTNLLVSLPDFDKSRRRSTIHSYTLSNYHTLPQDPDTLQTVREMSQGKALKNVIVLGLAFMFIFTAFVSLQGLQSSLHIKDGVGVFSLSSIYVGTIISCFFAPWIIQRFTTKWTMVITFVFFTGYFAGNFHPEHYMLIPLGALLGLLAGPLFGAQATSITTIALAYAEHSHMPDQDHVINKFMGIFCGLYRTSNIWGNLITTLVIHKNNSEMEGILHNHSNRSCGSRYCLKDDIMDDLSEDLLVTIDSNTKIMLLSIYMGCGVMGIVTLISLFDQHKRRKKTHPCNDDELTSSEIFLSTLKMFRDSKCQLLILIVVFVGLEQGFMFSDFTQVCYYLILYNYTYPLLLRLVSYRYMY